MNHFSWAMNNSFQMPSKQNTVSKHQNQNNVVQNIKSGFERSDPKIIKNNIYKFKVNDNK